MMTVFFIGIGAASVAEVERLNVRNAAALAMRPMRSTAS